MLDYILDTASFLPHGSRLSWRPDLVVLHVASDVTVGLAYFSIPLAILALLRRKPDFEFRPVAYLFMAFITLCGLGHFAGAAMLWFPYYGLDGLLKAATAIVSVITAATLWPLLPRIIAIPGQQALREANSRLEREIRDRMAAEAALREAHDDLERRVAERTAELARSEERARLAAEAGKVGLWDWDFGTNTVQRSAHCKTILGLEDDPPMPTFFDRVHPDDREEVEAKLRESLNTGVAQGQIRIVTSAGEIRWLDIRGTVFRAMTGDDPRSPRLLGTIIDVTDRVEAGEALQRSLTEKETLLREIHHRVKNNLQGLLSLLQMERRQIKDPALAGRFDSMRTRIQVMAGVHENLYTSESLSAVNMGRQMAALCDGLRELGSGTDRIEIVTDAEDLVCSIDVAVPLGLLANEIITNAAKHAFPEGRSGRIEISLRHCGDSVVLTVRDDGIGDTGRTGGGIGKQLIAAFARQLKAEITVDAVRGTTVRIVLPVDDFKLDPARASGSSMLPGTDSNLLALGI